MRNYTTIQGDTWDMVAFKVYGHERYLKELIETNPAHIHTAIFSGGIVLSCPDIPADTKQSVNLPPWKR